MRSKRSKAWHRRKQAKYITRAILGIERQCPWTHRDGKYWRHCQKREGHLGPHVDFEKVEFSSGVPSPRGALWRDPVSASAQLTIKVTDAAP